MTHSRDEGPIFSEWRLDVKERHLVEIAANTLGVDVPIDDLGEITAADLAAGLAQHEARESLVKQFVMLTTLDGEVTEDEVERLKELAQALAAEIDRIEEKMREEIPELQHVDLEAD